jgi:flagellar biosynthesis protein
MSAPEPPPGHRATALRYAAGQDAAPRVVATGRGHVAAAILERAREAGVPVREDPALVEALARLELAKEIPEELYAAVAEALVWADALDARTQERRA